MNALRRHPLIAETSIGGYENTGRDLVANLLGSLVGGYLVSARGSRPEEPAAVVE